MVLVSVIKYMNNIDNQYTKLFHLFCEIMEYVYVWVCMCMYAFLKKEKKTFVSLVLAKCQRTEVTR